MKDCFSPVKSSVVMLSSHASLSNCKSLGLCADTWSDRGLYQTSMMPVSNVSMMMGTARFSLTGRGHCTSCYVSPPDLAEQSACVVT